MSKIGNLVKAAAFATVVGAIGAAPASALSLFTTSAAGNGQDGVMFDVVVGASDITLTQVEFYTDNAPDAFELYVIEGGVDGHLTSAGDWRLVDSISGSGAAATELWNFADLVLSANTTYGLYLTGTDGNEGTLRYSDGTAVGDVAASNDDLSIFEGYGKAYAFGETFGPRVFNGTLFYELGSVTSAVPLPAALPLAAAGFGVMALIGRRRRA